MRLAVAVPSTFTSVVKNRPLRTYKIGALARFLSMYRVTHVYVYYDEDPYFDSHGLGKYIAKVLKYSVTPPWFKKAVFPPGTTDRTFGVIPPLQIRAHMSYTVAGRTWGVFDGEKILFYDEKGRKRVLPVREDLVALGYGGNVPNLIALERGKIISVDDLDRKKYIGFWPRYVNAELPKFLRWARKQYFVVGTSRHGDWIRNESTLFSLRQAKERDTLIVFGGHHRGIFEMGTSSDDYDVVVNLFRKQEVRTIRTEEATPLVLSALDLLV